MPQIFPLGFLSRFPVRLVSPQPVYTLRTPVVINRVPYVRPVLPTRDYKPSVFSGSAPFVQVLPTPKYLCQRYFVYDTTIKFLGPFPVVVEAGENVCYMTYAQAKYHIQHCYGVGLQRWADLTLSRRKYIRQMISANSRLLPWLPPIVGSALVNQLAVINAPMTPYIFSSGAFVDPDGDTHIVFTYTATLAGGGALPTWLIFNALTRQFSGTPDETGTVSVRVNATDQYGRVVSATFDIEVGSS